MTAREAHAIAKRERRRHDDDDGMRLGVVPRQPTKAWERRAPVYHPRAPEPRPEPLREIVQGTLGTRRERKLRARLARGSRRARALKAARARLVALDITRERAQERGRERASRLARRAS